MPLTMKEEIELQAAFMHIKRARRHALNRMFEGTQLVPKSLLADAKSLAADAKKAKADIAKVPGVSVPEIDVPSFNVRLFEGIDLRKLLELNIPALHVPGWNLSLIPDIRLGSIPGFDLPRVRLNLKGFLKYKDLFPDISLRALCWAIAVKMPHLTLPSIAFDLKLVLGLDLDLTRIFPDFMAIDLHLEMPNFAIPDVSLPVIGLPPFDISLPHIDLARLELPGIDLGLWIKVPGIDKVLKLLFELFDTIDVPAILADLGVQFIKDFIGAALPIAQQIKSGADVVHQWGMAAQQLHRSMKVDKHVPFILPGDARGACQAVKILLKESSGEYATRATIATTQFAVSTAGLFADLGAATGPAVSAAAAVAKMCQSITIYAIKYKEMKKINHVLSTSPAEALSVNIFAISPLLGCYFLANNDTSTVLNIMSSNIIEDVDWMTDAEQNIRHHLDPLIKDAQSFIAKSRFVLNPLRQNKGMWVERGGVEKLKEEFSLYFKKKFGVAPAGARVASHRYVG